MWAVSEIKQVWDKHWRRMDREVLLPILYKVVDAERENVYRDAHLDVFDCKHTYSIILQKSIVNMIRYLCTNHRRAWNYLEPFVVNFNKEV